MHLSNTFRQILIATDESKCSQNTVLKGVALAKSMGAKVYALNVLDTFTYVPSLLKKSAHFGSK